jgi:hypothetical protein
MAAILDFGNVAAILAQRHQIMEFEIAPEQRWEVYKYSKFRKSRVRKFADFKNFLD